MPRKTWLQRQRLLLERHAGTPTRLVVNLRHPELAHGRDSRPPPLSRNAPVAAFSIMSTRIVFIGPILILIRTPRLSMRNPPWGFNITIRLGDRILKNVTWIELCRRTIEVQACNESGHCWTILLGFRANLWAVSGRYRAAEIPPYTVAGIRRSEQTLPCISRHINAIGVSVSQIRTLAVKNFTNSVEMR